MRSSFAAAAEMGLFHGQSKFFAQGLQNPPNLPDAS
jgi:hypothetical protein